MWKTNAPTRWEKEFDDLCNPFDSITALDRWTDRQKCYKNKLCGRPPQYAPAPCKLTFDLLTLESVVRVTCDVGYLCANFSLPRPL